MITSRRKIWFKKYDKKNEWGLQWQAETLSRFRLSVECGWLEGRRRS